MKFTAPTKERHDIWFNALNYLLARPTVAPVPGSRAPLSPTSSTHPRLSPPEAPHRKETTESPHSQRSGRSANSGPTGENWNATPRAQRSLSRLSTYPVSIGKRAGTPAAEYLRWNGEPGSPSSAYHQVLDKMGYDEDLDFQVHTHDPEAEGFEGLENVRACCDGLHDVGTLSGRRHHHHHHHHHDHPVPPVPPFARSQPGTTRSSSRPPAPEQHPSRPASPSGWSLRSGKSNRGPSSREDGGGGGMFSWSKRSRKESAPVR